MKVEASLSTAYRYWVSPAELERMVNAWQTAKTEMDKDLADAIKERILKMLKEK